MDLGIKGRKAIVVGGSAGLGKGAALALAEEGVEVTLVARRKERLENAAQELSEATGAAVRSAVGDVSTEEGRAAIQAALPDPDIMVVTISPPTPNTDYRMVTTDDWRESIDTALIGPVELMRHFTPGMAERKWGRYVNITTVAAKWPLEIRLMSGPARAALANYTAVISRQLAKENVILNNVLPGVYPTAGFEEGLQKGMAANGLSRKEAMERFNQLFQIPTGTVGDPDDFGKFVAIMCSEAAKFTVGQNLVIDGGMCRSVF